MPRHALTMLICGALALTGCLGPEVLSEGTPQPDGLTVQYQCPGSTTVLVRPGGLWLPDDTLSPDTLTLTALYGVGERSSPCSYRIVGLDDTLSNARLLAARLVDTTLRVVLQGYRPGWGRIALLYNGRYNSSITLLTTTNRFRATAIGHKGAGPDWPENTLVAIDVAQRAGLTGSEVDVRLTRDTIAVLMHDSTVDRTTDGTGAIEDLTASQALGLDAGSYVGPQFHGERVPTLAAALAAATTVGYELILDIKPQFVVPPAAEAQLIIALLRAVGAEGRVSLLSPSVEFLKAARQASPTVRLMILAAGYKPGHVTFARAIGAEAIMYDPDSLLGESLKAPLDSLQAIGVGVVASTTNNPAQIDALAKVPSLKGILTGIPPQLLSMPRN